MGWLERVPSYKDQQQKLQEKELDTYGFLGYPLLQAADILIYRAGYVPVGADQVAHVELTREVARRFNHVYGREPGFEENAEAAIKKMGKKLGGFMCNFEQPIRSREIMKHLRKPGLCFKNSRIFPSGTVSACLVILKAAGR